jgi:DNA-binding CsgD family transcriptional regulator
MTMQVALFLPLDLILLFFCTRWVSSSLVAENRPAAHAQKYKVAFSNLWVSFACIALLSLIAPMAGTALLDARIDTYVRVFLALFGNIGAATALYICWQLIKIPVTFERLGLVIFPILATAFILLVVAPAAYGLFFLFMGDMLFCLISMLAISTSIEISLDRKIGIVVVFGAIAGTMCLGRLVGWSVGMVIGVIPAFSNYQLPVVAVVLLYSFAILIYFVERSRRKRRVEGETRVDDSPSADSISLRCEKLTKLHKLSTRESEVLDLLAHGRDIPSIAKILFLSENTVRTHAKRLYRSLDIHSRQELIDMLEKSADAL